MNDFNEQEVFDEFELNSKIQKEIESKAAELKDKKALRRVFPIAVKGDEYDDKQLYVAYFKQPSFMSLSKYMQLAKTDSMGAMRELAKECYLDGDKELIEDESLFAFGLMPHLTDLIEVRKGKLVSLSKTGK